jgi:hypothetical protein
LLIDGDMVSVTLIVQYFSDLHMSVSLESWEQACPGDYNNMGRLKELPILL